MSWWRRSGNQPTPAPVVDPVFTEVRIIKPTQSNDIAAELSEAFSGSGPEPTGDDSGATGPEHHGWSDDPSRPVDASPTGDGDELTGETTQPTNRTLIAVGGHDDLPDAIYLDDEPSAEEDDSSGIVFIDDDDGIGDAVALKDATGRSIEPRLRERRIGVRRAEGRRRLKWTAVVAVVVVLCVGVLALLGSSLFSVNEVQVVGQQNADAAAVDEVVAELTGKPVLLVDTDAVETQLEDIAFVEEARVRTDFPSGATIELRERTPIATVQGTDGQFRILDAQGRVLDVIAGRPVAFVLISGTTPLDLGEGQFASAGYASAASIVTKLTPAVRSRLVSISVTPDGSDMRFVLSNGDGGNIDVRLGSAITDDDQIQRLVRLERLLDEQAGVDAAVIDVSTREATER